MEQPTDFSCLAAGDAVAGLARVLDAAVAVTRTGDTYLRLRLADGAGHAITAVLFRDAPAPPRIGGVVGVAGRAERFREALSLRLDACVEVPGADAARFLPRMPPTRAAALADLDALVARIADPRLRAVVGGCLAEVGPDRLARAPAAVAHHGARVGGLLAHTVRVATVALTLADALGPSWLDRDVVLAGALLHDLGKPRELPEEPGFGLTDDGRLVGHVLLGALLIERAASRVEGLAPDRLREVMHAAVAAHGRVEHGAPVPPATLEALLVHLADLAEATIEAAIEAVEAAAPGDAWARRGGAPRAPIRVPRTVGSGPTPGSGAGGPT